MFAIHFGIWEIWVKEHESKFIRYYLFLSLIFIMVITILSIAKKLYPQYIGFVFLGLILFKLSLIFIVLNKLNLNEIPNKNLHFIPPYLISLTLEALYAIHLLKDEKNQ